MVADIQLQINGRTQTITTDPDTPLLYILRQDMGLKSPKYGCGLEQCGACMVLVDGQATPSCRLPVQQVRGSDIVTLEGLGTADKLYHDLFAQPDQPLLIVAGTAVDDPIPPATIPSQLRQSRGQTVQAAYHRPYQMHASLAHRRRWRSMKTAS